jgi:DNA-binding beta-propeller fold protein YncE
MPRSTAGLCGLLAICLGLVATPARAAFTAFESGHVRGLALSADGSRLYAVNTPDNRLEIFEVSDAGLLHLSSVPVGLEPVAVAVRGANEVWVVNQLSDDVSIVSTAGTPRVLRTLLVGDEPSDVVFAGPGGNRAFVTAARRGQNSPIAASNLTPGIGRALVFVFDANALGVPAGGAPIAVLTLFGDAPRGLAASPDGSRVYAGIFHSGNRTTTIPVGTVQAIAPALLPSQAGGQPAPPVSQIVRWNGSQWLDDRGRDWTAQVRFSLPDQDVFSIDANATPALMPGSIVPFANVGTILFNLAVNPRTAVCGHERRGPQRDAPRARASR